MSGTISWPKDEQRRQRVASRRIQREAVQMGRIERRNNRAPTSAQLYLIEQLCAQLGRPVPAVSGRAAASALIDQLKQNLAVRGQATPATSTIAPTRSSGAHEEAAAPL